MYLRTVTESVEKLGTTEELEDVKKKLFDPLVTGMEIEVVTALAKDAFEELLGGREDTVRDEKEQKENLEMHLSRLEALLTVHASNQPELEEKTRLYIMDRDRDIVMPPTIEKLKKFTEAVSEALSKNIKIDNTSSVNRGYNSYLSNKFNTYTDTNYFASQNDNKQSYNDNNKGKKPGNNGGGKMDIIR